jgi:hypothetical protein
MAKALALGIGILALVAMPAAAQDPARHEATSLVLVGFGATKQITPEILAHLPRLQQDVAYQTSKGEFRAKLEGVLLWDVIADAGLIKGEGHPELQHSLRVQGRDGYNVVFSMGEISPAFGNRPVMLSINRSQSSGRDEFRVVVPGDSRGARNVRDVARIELR